MADTDLSDTSEEVLTAAEKRRITRACADDEPPKAPKKSKTQHADDTDVDMEPVSEPILPKHKTTKSKTVAAEPVQTKKGKTIARGSAQAAVAKPTQKRKAHCNFSDSDDESDEAAKLSPKQPIQKASKAPTGNASVVQPKPKPKKSATSDDDVENDGALSQSEDENKSDSGSQSDEDDTLDLNAERPQVIEHNAKPVTEDYLLNFDMDHDPVILPQPAPVKRSGKAVTARQSKYDAENLEIGASKVIHDQPSTKKPKASAESDWHVSAHITFPTTGGQIKLLNQNPLLHTVVKGSFNRSLHELAFKDGYPPVPHALFSQRLIRLTAKKVPGAEHIGRHAKKDLEFCQCFAPIICARGGNVRTTIRTSAISKVATHYELNKPGITQSQIRSIVKQLMKKQQYIMLYGPPPIDDPPAAGSVADVADDAAEVKKTPKNLKAFIMDKPFHAPAITDIINEVWWSNSKVFGFQHLKKLKSHWEDRPGEIGLPDPMICIVAANVRDGQDPAGTYIPEEAHSR
ncbi:hypothetical protein B0H10DRAFT_2224120 [Mycena sp. CBHHK59/15]|nr:hypothetical protein B0H10DRAFT_2224120 [Mycena sp. CBHHK59/15]